MKYVTQDSPGQTAVSFTTGTDIEGAVLNVRRIHRTTDRAKADRLRPFGRAQGPFFSPDERPVCSLCGSADVERHTLDWMCGTCGRTFEPTGGSYEVVVPADHDGKRFASLEEAKSFAIERGYLRAYFSSPGFRAERVRRAFDPRTLRDVELPKGSVGRALDRAIAAENRSAV